MVSRVLVPLGILGFVLVSLLGWDRTRRAYRGCGSTYDRVFAVSFYTVTSLGLSALIWLSLIQGSPGTSVIFGSGVLFCAFASLRTLTWHRTGSESSQHYTASRRYSMGFAIAILVFSVVVWALVYFVAHGTASIGILAIGVVGAIVVAVKARAGASDHS